MYKRNLCSDVVVSLVTLLKSTNNSEIECDDSCIPNFALEYNKGVNPLVNAITIYGVGELLGIIILEDYQQYRKNTLYLTQEGRWRDREVIRLLKDISKPSVDQ